MGRLGTAYHEVRIANMVLYNSSSKNDDACLLCKNRLVVHGTNVRNNIDNQTWTLVRVEINHVAQGPVSQGGTKDGDVILDKSIKMVFGE